MQKRDWGDFLVFLSLLPPALAVGIVGQGLGSKVKVTRSENVIPGNSHVKSLWPMV